MSTPAIGRSPGGPWPGLVNFRDVGGVPGADGRRVRAGRLFRGTALHEATEADLEALSALGVGLVFDLRSDGEVALRPDRLPSGARHLRRSGIASMDELGPSLLNWDALLFALSDDTVLTEHEAFQYDVYPEMARRPEAFAGLLHELLASPGGATYVHCSAGKDRTGVACAIVLRLLGVDHEHILADYLASGANPLPEAAGVRVKAVKYGPRVAALIERMVGVTPRQLEEMFAEADRVWGSWTGFVRDGLGLTPSDVNSLQQAYLEP